MFLYKQLYTIHPIHKLSSEILYSDSCQYLGIHVAGFQHAPVAYQFLNQYSKFVIFSYQVYFCSSMGNCCAKILPCTVPSLPWHFCGLLQPRPMTGKCMRVPIWDCKFIDTNFEDGPACQHLEKLLKMVVTPGCDGIFWLMYSRALIVISYTAVSKLGDWSLYVKWEVAVTNTPTCSKSTLVSSKYCCTSCSLKSLLLQ